MENLWLGMEDVDARLEQPRFRGMTEIRSPYFSVMGPHCIQECKDIGFDTLELNTDFLNFQEDDLLRLIRLVKSEGLKAKPQLDVRIRDASSLQDLQKEMDLLIKRAERCLEAGADMIMFDADGITKGVHEWRTDLVAKMIGRLGLRKIMFEADEPESVQWFVNNYGSGVNLFIDHTHVQKLECLRTSANRAGARGWGHTLLPM